MQTTNMIRNAATPAYERRRKIEEAVANMNFNNDPTAKEFNVSVESKMTKVTGEFSSLIKNLLLLHAYIFFNRPSPACPKITLWSGFGACRSTKRLYSERWRLEHDGQEICGLEADEALGRFEHYSCHR